MKNKNVKEFKITANGSRCPPEVAVAIKELYATRPELQGNIRKDDSWIQTYTGKKFYPLNPRIEDIDIEDIAHALSMVCRYTGHCQKFFSVAEHSVLVSYLGDEKFGLLHDGSECYIADIASPIKRMPEFSFYRDIEKNLQTMIYRKFGLISPEPDSLKKADLLMLSTEAYYLLNPLHPEWKIPYKPLPIQVKCLPPAEAKILFLDRFHELFG